MQRPSYSVHSEQITDHPLPVSYPSFPLPIDLSYRPGSLEKQSPRRPTRSLKPALRERPLSLPSRSTTLM